ncbi:hypothetical protein GCM10009837_67150 [Streptomyces durmitorensis]
MVAVGAAAVAPDGSTSPAVTAAAVAMAYVRMRRLCGMAALTRSTGRGSAWCDRRRAELVVWTSPLVGAGFKMGERDLRCYGRLRRSTGDVPPLAGHLMRQLGVARERSLSATVSSLPARARRVRARKPGDALVQATTEGAMRGATPATLSFWQTG